MTGDWAAETSSAAPSAAARPETNAGRASDRGPGGVERRASRQQTGARDKAHLQPDAVRVLEKHIVIARRPVAFLGSAYDGRFHLLERVRAPIDILARTGSQAEVVEADALLLEALGSQRRVAGFDADRRPAADAVKEF